MTEAVSDSKRPTVLFLVALAMTFPTVMAWLYSRAMSGTGDYSVAQQFAYTIAKIVQFAIPVVFLVFVARRWPRWQPTTDGLLLGLAFGALVFAVMLALYFGLLRSSPLLAEAPARLLAKMEEFGVASPLGFLGLAVFLCVAHSFLEEYYWRWFVFGQLRTLMPMWLAILLSSLGFMAHHVLILWAYLPNQVLTGIVPASLAVAVGGAVWAWLYQRTGSLLAPWLSHALVDAALFVIGWDMLKTAASTMG